MTVLLTATRSIFTPLSTISPWTITRNGETRPLVPAVLEDVDRGLAARMGEKEILRRKVKGATAIPVGEYPIVVTFSPKFGRPMPAIVGVPGFSGIRIHRGARAEHTEGCPLPGLRAGIDEVFDSPAATELVYAVIDEARARGENVRIRIQRDPETWLPFKAANPDIVKEAA